MRGDLVWAALQRFPALRLSDDQVREWASRARSQKSFPEIFRNLFERMSKKSPQNVQIAAKAIIFEILKQENDIPEDAQLVQMQWHAKGGVKTLAKVVYKINGELVGRSLNVPLKDQDRHFMREARNRIKMQRKISPILQDLKQRIQFLKDIDDRSAEQEAELDAMQAELKGKELRLMALLKAPLDGTAVRKGYYLSAFLVGETLLEEFDTAFRKAYPQAISLDVEDDEALQKYYALQNRFAEEHPEVVLPVIKKMLHAYWTFLKDTNMTVLPGDIHPGNIMMLVLGMYTGKGEAGLFDFGLVGIPGRADGIDYPRDIAGSLYQVLKLYLEQDRKPGSSPKRSNMEFASSIPSKLNFHKIFQPTGGEKMLANPLAMNAFIESIRDAFGEDVRRRVYERLKDEKVASGSPLAVFRAHLAPYYERPVLDIKQAMIKGRLGDLKDALLQRKQAMEDLMALAMEDERFSARDMQNIRDRKDKDLRAFIIEGIPAILQKLGTPPGEEDAWSLTEFERSLDALGSRLRLEELDLLPGERRNLVELSMGFDNRDTERKRVLKDMFVLMRQLRYSDPQHMGKTFLEEYFQPAGFLEYRASGVSLDAKSLDFLSDLAGEGKLARMAARARHALNAMMPARAAATEAHAFGHYVGASNRNPPRDAGKKLLKKAIEVKRQELESFHHMLDMHRNGFVHAMESEAKRDKFLHATKPMIINAMTLAESYLNNDIPKTGMRLPAISLGGKDMNVVFVPMKALFEETGVMTNSYKTDIGDNHYIFLSRELLSESPHAFLQAFVHEWLEDQAVPREAKAKLRYFSHSVMRGYEALFNEKTANRKLGQVSDLMRVDMRRGGKNYLQTIAERLDFVLAWEIPQKIRLKELTPEQAMKGNGHSGWALDLAKNVTRAANAMAKERVSFDIDFGPGPYVTNRLLVESAL